MTPQEEIVREWLEQPLVNANFGFGAVFVDLATRAYTAGQQSRDAEVKQLNFWLNDARSRCESSEMLSGMIVSRDVRIAELEAALKARQTSEAINEDHRIDNQHQ